MGRRNRREGALNLRMSFVGPSLPRSTFQPYARMSSSGAPFGIRTPIRWALYRLRVYSYLGAYRSAGLGRCGLCGTERAMTEAHVPPRGVGNRAPEREKARWAVDSHGARLSS